MPTDPTLLNIYGRLASLEGPDLSATAAALNPGDPSAYPPIPPAVLTAFATFPTKDDIAAGVPYPYTCHGCDVSVFQPAALDPSDNQRTHTMWAGLVYGEGGDPLAALSERDAAWREAYIAFFLLHLRLTDMNVDLATAIVTMEPLSFDLFNNPQIGIKISWPIRARVILPTGQ
jgi:hypothetical protein